MRYTDDKKMNIMTYTMASGIKGTIPLTKEQVDFWVSCFNSGEMFVIESGEELFGLNPKLIADFRLHNEFSEQRNHIERVDRGNIEMQNAYESVSKLIKVDCKCGTVYTTESTKRREWHCSKCKAIIYLKDEQLIDTIKGKAYLMTNKLEIKIN